MDFLLKLLITVILLIVAAPVVVRESKEALYELRTGHIQSTTTFTNDKPGFKDLVKLYQDSGIKFPRVAAAQTLLETNYLTSNIYDQNKNCFGMRHNNRGFSIKEQNGHACYANHIDSVKDYVQWQKMCFRYKQIDSEEEYINMLDDLPFRKGSRYAEDLSYTSKVREILKTF